MTTVRSGNRRWRRPEVILVDMISRFQLRFGLQGVYLDAEAYTADSGTVDFWLANHTSRYDGFLMWTVKHRVDGKGRLFTIMLEETLSRHPVFRGSGAVGLTPGSTRSVRELVRFVSRVPRAGDSILFFPQGKIFSGDQVPPDVGSITRIGLMGDGRSRFVPCAIAVEMLENRKPTAFIRLADPVPARDDASVSRAEHALSQAMRSLRADLSAHGECLPAHWNGVRLN